VRFARGVQRYIEENKVQKLQEIFDSVEVLIIDDIHLTAINDFNREIVSKILNKFIGEYKQIVISSKYPPESLTRFEELINFKLNQGWVSELKPPRMQHLSRIYNKMSDGAGLGLTEAMAQTFFGGENLTLGDIAKNIRRVKVLHRRIVDSGNPEKTYGELLTEMLSVHGENEKSEIIKKDISDIKSLVRMENAEWGNFGFFYPRGQEDKFNWISFAIMQKAKELGIGGGLRFSLKSAYSTENIISSAFKIANICDNKNLKGAIILGPSIAAVQATIRENFYDILSHMLEVMMIRCGIIDAENIKRPSVYMLALGDIIK
jgi:chromosomal replication initiator protein